MKATWKDTTIAERDDTVVVEGNHYFPEAAVDKSKLRASSTHTTCPWKGIASYYDVVVGNEVFNSLLVEEGSGQGEPAFRRIVCPVDYTRASGAAFERAVALASMFEAELTVLYVMENVQTGVSDPEAEIERLRAWIGDVPLPLRAKLLVHRGDAAEQVIFYAKENAADLLVIGARPRNVANQTVLGSTTEKLTRHAPCAVLTVPA